MCGKNTGGFLESSKTPRRYATDPIYIVMFLCMFLGLSHSKNKILNFSAMTTWLVMADFSVDVFLASNLLPAFNSLSFLIFKSLSRMSLNNLFLKRIYSLQNNQIIIYFIIAKFIRK
jgi:hypothetical protein